MPATASGHYGGLTSGGQSEHGRSVGGGTVFSDPGSFAGQLINGVQIVPALFVWWISLQWFHIQYPVAIKNRLMLFIERVGFAPGCPIATPDFLPIHRPAAHFAAAIGEPYMLTIGDWGRRCGITIAVHHGAFGHPF